MEKLYEKDNPSYCCVSLCEVGVLTLLAVALKGKSLRRTLLVEL